MRLHNALIGNPVKNRSCSHNCNADERACVPLEYREGALENDAEPGDLP